VPQEVEHEPQSEVDQANVTQVGLGHGWLVAGRAPSQFSSGAGRPFEALQKTSRVATPSVPQLTVQLLQSAADHA
jgi:hypothetical protein